MKQRVPFPLRTAADPFSNFRGNAANLRCGNIAASNYKPDKKVPGAPFLRTTIGAAAGLRKAEDVRVYKNPGPNPFEDYGGRRTYRTLPRFIPNTHDRRHDPRSPNHFSGRRNRQSASGGGGAPGTTARTAPSSIFYPSSKGLDESLRISPRQRRIRSRNRTTASTSTYLDNERSATRATYSGGMQYTCLPPNGEALITSPRSRAYSTAPCRPSAQLRRHRKARQHQQTVRRAARQQQAGATAPAHEQDHDNDKKNGDPYPMVPGLVRIAPTTVTLENLPVMRKAKMTLPITNHTSSVLAHLRPGQIKLASRNVCAEIVSQPTLLAPKQTAHVVLELSASFPGQSFVELSFLGKTLCLITVSAVEVDADGDTMPPGRRVEEDSEEEGEENAEEVWLESSGRSNYNL